MKHCIVVGGGVAGLAAALRLSSDTRWRVTLLEGAPAFGGRVRSFVDRQSGAELDNGQHVLMGACTAATEYLERVGTLQALSRLRGMALPFAHADGRRALLQAGSLPHPFSLVQAFLRYDMLPLKARLRLLVAAARIRLRPADAAGLDAITAERWLRSLGQSDEELSALWEPVILATMNAAPSRASARLFATLLAEIFFSSRDAADMLLPTSGLSALFIDPAVTELRRSGADVRAGTSVTAVQCADAAGRDGARNGRHVVALHAGENRLEADAVVIALPPWALRRLRCIEAGDRGAARSFPPESGSRPLAEIAIPGIDLDVFEPSEILSIHVWLRREAGTAPMAGLLGTTLQWVFFKGRTAEGLYHYSCTVSGAAGDETADSDALRRKLVRELSLLAPGLREGDIARILPIREKRATFVPAPGIESSRPGPRSAISGLYLAGDWTATGLPATIESAVRSGYSAAVAVLEENDK